MFEECLVTYEKIVLSSKLIKILVPIAVILVIAAVVVVYVVLKRKKRSMREKNKSLPKGDGQKLI